MAFGWYGVLLGEAKVGGRKSSQASVSAATGDELAVHPRGRDFCCPCCWGGGVAVLECSHYLHPCSSVPGSNWLRYPKAGTPTLVDGSPQVLLLLLGTGGQPPAWPGAAIQDSSLQRCSPVPLKLTEATCS